MKVQNMLSNKGNKIANQFIISGLPAGTINQDDTGRIGSGDMFQSYDSNIAYRDYLGKVYLDSHYWDYSVTTGKYRNQFLNESIAETRKKIDSGEYILTDLN